MVEFSFNGKINSVACLFFPTSYRYLPVGKQDFVSMSWYIIELLLNWWTSWKRDKLLRKLARKFVNWTSFDGDRYENVRMKRQTRKENVVTKAKWNIVKVKESVEVKRSWLLIIGKRVIKNDAEYISYKNILYKWIQS